MLISDWSSDVCSSDLPSARVALGGAIPDDGADMRECLAYLDVGNQIVEEGPLAAERFQGPVRLDASMVDPARQIVKPFGAVAEMRRQPRHLLRRQVGPREDAKPFHLPLRHRADAVAPPERQRLDEGGPLARRKAVQPARLALV